MKGESVSWNLSDRKLISREEVSRTLAKAKKSDPLDYLFFATAANVGFRLCEVTHLRAEDIRDGGISVVRRKRSVLRPEFHPITDELAKLLMARAKKVGSGWLWSGNSGPCHRNRRKDGQTVDREKLCDGGHISGREIQRRWTRYSEAAGTLRDKRGVHSLRHYAATAFYKETRDLRATQVYIGHSSSKITETYAHVVDMAEKVRKVKPVL